MGSWFEGCLSARFCLGPRLSERLNRIEPAAAVAAAAASIVAAAAAELHPGASGLRRWLSRPQSRGTGRIERYLRCSSWK